MTEEKEITRINIPFPCLDGRGRRMGMAYMILEREDGRLELREHYTRNGRLTALWIYRRLHDSRAAAFVHMAKLSGEAQDRAVKKYGRTEFGTNWVLR